MVRGCSRALFENIVRGNLHASAAAPVWLRCADTVDIGETSYSMVCRLPPCLRPSRALCTAFALTLQPGLSPDLFCSQVLADDLNGNGRMDLLVSTMNGNVYRWAPSEPATFTQCPAPLPPGEQALHRIGNWQALVENQHETLAAGKGTLGNILPM